MSSSSVKNVRPAPAELDAAIGRIQRAENSEEALAALAKAIQPLFAAARIYAVHAQELRGLVAVDRSRIDTTAITVQRLQLSKLTVGERAVRDRVPYIGPLPPAHPLTRLFGHARAPMSLVVWPIALDRRTEYLLVGQPEAPITSQLRTTLEHMTKATGMVLSRAASACSGDTARSLPRIDMEHHKGSFPRAGEDEPQRRMASGNDREHDVARGGGAAMTTVSRNRDNGMRNSEDGLNGRERLAEETGTGPESSMSADAASLVDRRTSIRLLHVIEVTHTSDHNFFIGFTEDISEGGLFVATYAAIEIGELLELSFAVPGLEQVQKVQCRVRWAREDNPSNPDLIPGVGVSFLDLSAEAMTAIQEFIRHRGAIFYPD